MALGCSLLAGTTTCFTCPDQVAIRWLNRVAAHLREQGVDVSSAQVIDAVRLSEALAAMRDRPVPGLGELHEAAQAVLLSGESLPWSLIHDTLVVGTCIGQVPVETPMVPLQCDLVRLQKRLRLKPEDGDRDLELDLRNELHRERSVLLRRLRIIGIPWGEGGQRGEGTGTFKETWELAWDPEFALQIIEASPHGTTIQAAASSLALQKAKRSRLAARTGPPRRKRRARRLVRRHPRHHGPYADRSRRRQRPITSDARRSSSRPPRSLR